MLGRKMKFLAFFPTVSSFLHQGYLSEPMELLQNEVPITYLQQVVFCFVLLLFSILMCGSWELKLLSY